MKINVWRSPASGAASSRFHLDRSDVSCRTERGWYWNDTRVVPRGARVVLERLACRAVRSEGGNGTTAVSCRTERGGHGNAALSCRRARGWQWNEPVSCRTKQGSYWNDSRVVPHDQGVVMNRPPSVIARRRFLSKGLTSGAARGEGDIDTKHGRRDRTRGRVATVTSAGRLRRDRAASRGGGRTTTP
jgi:hypothetical protein